MGWFRDRKPSELDRLAQAFDEREHHIEDDLGPEVDPGLQHLRREIRALVSAQRLGHRELRQELKDAAYWGTIVLVLTVVLLLMQNGLLWRQVWQLQTDLKSSQRVELLTLIFEPSDCDPELERAKLHRQLASAEQSLKQAAPDSGAAYRARYELRVLASRDLEICPPETPLRLREEALLTLAAMDGPRLALRRADLRHMSLRKAPLEGVSLSGADLSGANLSDADLRDAYLRRVKAIGTYLKDANLKLATLKDADLTAAYLTEADLTDANLVDARLVDANLIRTQFRRADLKRADLTDADLGGADLSNAFNLTQAQLDSAYGTHKTLLPEGLVHPDHWRKAGEPKRIVVRDENSLDPAPP